MKEGKIMSWWVVLGGWRDLRTWWHQIHDLSRILNSDWGVEKHWNCFLSIQWFERLTHQVNSTRYLTQICISILSNSNGHRDCPCFSKSSIWRDLENAADGKLGPDAGVVVVWEEDENEEFEMLSVVAEESKENEWIKIYLVALNSSVALFCRDISLSSQISLLQSIEIRLHFSKLATTLVLNSCQVLYYSC